MSIKFCGFNTSEMLFYVREFSEGVVITSGDGDKYDWEIKTKRRSEDGGLIYSSYTGTLFFIASAAFKPYLENAKQRREDARNKYKKLTEQIERIRGEEL